MTFLVVVDMQTDFVDGALGTKEAVAILPAVCARIRAAAGAGEPVFATMDTHGPDYLSTQEGRNLPVVHCWKGTPGWQLHPLVRQALDAVAPERLCILEKPTFGAQALPAALQKAMEDEGVPERIEFIGLCTGICVISNALLCKAAFPEIPLAVDAACCACVTPQSHETALDAMRLCQIDIENRPAAAP